MSMDIATRGGVAQVRSSPVPATICIGRERVHAKTARAVVLTCPDCRIAGGILESLVRQSFHFVSYELFDDPRLLGGAMGLADFSPPDHQKDILDHLIALADMHRAEEIILTSHGGYNGCGWCRSMGKTFSDRKVEQDFHSITARLIVARLKEMMPQRIIHHAYIELHDDEEGTASINPSYSL